MSESIESLAKEFEQRTTEELISILRNRDEDEWRPEVFEIVASVLRDRGISPDEVVAMGPEGVDVVESEPTVTIAHFFSPAEAHAARMASRTLAWLHGSPMKLEAPSIVLALVPASRCGRRRQTVPARFSRPPRSLVSTCRPSFPSLLVRHVVHLTSRSKRGLMKVTRASQAGASGASGTTCAQSAARRGHHESPLRQRTIRRTNECS